MIHAMTINKKTMESDKYMSKRLYPLSQMIVVVTESLIYNQGISYHKQKCSSLKQITYLIVENKN